jgi:hypothetical protein
MHEESKSDGDKMNGKLQFKNIRRAKYDSRSPMEVNRMKLLLSLLGDWMRVEPTANGHLVVTDRYDNIYGYIDFFTGAFVNYEDGNEYRGVNDNVAIHQELSE